MMKVGKLLICLLLIGVGIRQMMSGVSEMRGASGSGLPSEADAQAAATKDLGSMEVYEDAGHHIRLMRPKTWETVEPKTQILAVFRTYKGVVNVNAIVQDLPKTASLEEYAKLNFTEDKAALAKQGPVSEVEEGPIEMGSSPARKLSLSYVAPSNKMTVHLMQAVTVKNGHGYILTYTAPQQYYPIYLPVFLAMAKSLDVK